MRSFPLLLLVAFSLLRSGLRAQETEGKVIKLEPFNVRAYSGKIRLVDGFTGRDYEGANDVVMEFARSFNKLLLGFHKKLVHDEVRHLEMRDKFGKDFEREMRQLAGSFGFAKFSLDDRTWLARERSIITRLVRAPFFEIEALVVWDLDRLKENAPSKPKTPYAADIRYDAASGRWERRMMAKWAVYFYRPDEGDFYTEKQQGLNLETLRGFHMIDNGLPVDVPPEAFKKVGLTYPIFFSVDDLGAPAVRRLQEQFIANLHFIYDPFSWVNRRNLRFRGGFAQECLDLVQKQKLPIDDRKWFDPVLSRFFSDVITIKLLTAREIYSFHMQQKRLGESPRSLGVGLDLLNWNPDEQRAAKDVPEAPAQIALEPPSGFRFVMIDAYQRHGDALIDRLRTRLVELKNRPQPVNGNQLLRETIEQVSGLPFAEFAARAKATQEANLDQFRVTGPAT